MTKTVKIIVAVIAILAICGGIAGVVAWTQSDKFDQKNLSYIGRYKIGGLDSNGNYSNVNTSIYTADPFECQGLNCTLDFDATVTYEIFFYDQNKNFVHQTGKQEGSFDEKSVLPFAKYARIVITPKDDNKVTQLEKDKYAKQLTIKVNREQGYKNYTENLFVFEDEGKIKLNSNGGRVEDESLSSNNKISNYVPLSSYKEGAMFALDSVSDVSHVTLFFYDANKQFTQHLSLSALASSHFTTSLGKVYYYIDFSSLEFDYSYVRTFVSVRWQPVLICR